MHYYKITTPLLQITMQLLRFNSDYTSITSSLLPITLQLLHFTSDPLLHITFLSISNTTNYLRKVMRSHGSITTYYVPGQLADEVLYVVPMSSILGRLSLVPVGDTGTIPFQMRGESADFPVASCDKTQGGRDGCRWWYVNSWALSWGTKQ